MTEKLKDLLKLYSGDVLSTLLKQTGKASLFNDVDLQFMEMGFLSSKISSQCFFKKCMPALRLAVDEGVVNMGLCTRKKNLQLVYISQLRQPVRRV